MSNNTPTLRQLMVAHILKGSEFFTDASELEDMTDEELLTVYTNHVRRK